MLRVGVDGRVNGAQWQSRENDEDTAWSEVARTLAGQALGPERWDELAGTARTGK